jgi:rod shape determining protein RodA
MKPRREAFWQTVAAWHFAFPLALSLIGLLALYSTTYTGSAMPSRTALMQVLWIAAGVGLYLLIARIRVGVKPANFLPFLVPIEALLLLTLAVGWVAHGSRRWLKLGELTVQPSEFAKLFAVFLLAYFLSEYARSEEGRRFFSALGVLIALYIPIVLQPDLGTAMVFLALFVTVMWVKPLPRRYLIGFFAALVLIALPGWFVLKDYQRDRIMAFVHPSRDILGSGYHVNQSKIAVGSGGMWGKGYLHGTQTQGQFIPVQAADFIFATVGEEWGFIGCLAVLALFGAYFWKILALAKRVRGDYQRLIVYGVLAVMFFQLFINVGMTIGVTPVTGLPLPFLSAGGSSMVTMWSLSGMLASLQRHLPAGAG